MSCGSAVDSTYWVSARGAGATRASRVGWEYWRCEELEDKPFSSSSEGLLRCRKSRAEEVGRLRLTTLSSAWEAETFLPSSLNSLSTPSDISSRWSIHVSCTPLFTRIRVDKFRARTSRKRSESLSGERSAERLDWVDIEL
jgi:hypothetical protein